MKSTTLKRCLIASVIALAVIGSFAGVQLYRATDQQLSVKPERYSSEIELQPIESNIGLQTRLPFQTLIAAAEAATVDAQTGTGERQTCKKVLGAKVCATLQWQYKIGRDGNVEISANNNRLQLSMPISFEGVVSVDGRGGKLLGLRNKDINGKLKLVADLDIAIGTDWCPVIDSRISYQWISDPRIRVLGDIRINLKKSVDKALQSKLEELQTTLKKLIDCRQLRNEITKQWHVHTVKVSASGEDNWLHIKPISAAASDIAIEQDHIRFSFELGAVVELQPNDLPQQPNTTLPGLQPYTQRPGTVELSLFVVIPYQQLTDTLSQKLVGETFGEKNSISIKTIDVYPSGELLTVDIGFSAKTSGNIFTSNGNVYISARPVTDPTNNILHLSELSLTRNLDSGLMSALSAVLHNQVLKTLQSESRINIDPSLTKVEQSIVEALSDPAKTGGIEVNLDPPDIRLMDLNAQAQGLAAIVHLSTRLEAKIPEDVLLR